uniref:Uncharacterized protein n=1 Tax=Arundo donax TaxID=35708 RepID=A0A0A9H2L5_ARUDO
MVLNFFAFLKRRINSSVPLALPHSLDQYGLQLVLPMVGLSTSVKLMEPCSWLIPSVANRSNSPH